MKERDGRREEREGEDRREEERTGRREERRKASSAGKVNMSIRPGFCSLVSPSAGHSGHSSRS